MHEFLKRLPKVELHLHIEGTLEPELLFTLAERNGVMLSYASIEDVYAAYDFSDLQSFLDIYYQGMSVLQKAEDFYALAMDYFRRASNEGVVHVEMHFDPQAHISRGVGLSTILEGLNLARQEAESELGLSSALIMAFLRDRPAAEAMQVLESAKPYWDILDAVGLDSAEKGNPPEKFSEVFGRAKQIGIPRVAHAGEEGPVDYIYQALDLLDVCRIDHGVQCLQDPALVERLRNQGTVLTVCPLSNVRLKVVESMQAHPLPQLLDAGLVVTINSDDPAYFGGGMLANFMACHQAFGWQEAVFCKLAANAIDNAFMGEVRKAQLYERLKDVAGC